MPTDTRHLISDAEYATRIAALRTELGARGVAGALVWGRGGGSVDRCADLRYLTGFYPAFPTIRNVPNVWSDRGLACVLVTADEVVLFSDEPEASEAAHGITTSIARSGVGARTLAGDVVDWLSAHPELDSIAIVAGDAMSGHQARELLAAAELSERKLDWDDQLVEQFRRAKSPAEIAIMRRAAEIARDALEAGFARIAPGVSEAEVVSAMAAVVSGSEAVLANAFVYTIAADGSMEDNRAPIHSARRFAAGDLFTVDLSGTFAGYFFDLARSVVVGAEPTLEQQRVYELARGAVDAVVAELRPGAVLGDAARVGSDLLREAGIDPESAEFPARGHGLGLAFESPWVRDDSPEILEAGMVISIEQFAWIGPIGATYERNILITEDGPEDLVAVRDFWVTPAAERQA